MTDQKLLMTLLSQKLMLDEFYEARERNACNSDVIMDQHRYQNDLKAYIILDIWLPPHMKTCIFPDSQMWCWFWKSSALSEFVFSSRKRRKTDWQSSLKLEMIRISNNLEHAQLFKNVRMTQFYLVLVLKMNIEINNSIILFPLTR